MSGPSLARRRRSRRVQVELGGVWRGRGVESRATTRRTNVSIDCAWPGASPEQTPYNAVRVATVGEARSAPHLLCRGHHPAGLRPQW